MDEPSPVRPSTVGIKHGHDANLSHCAGVVLPASSLGCQRSVEVTKQMTWECAPEEYKAGYYARPDEYVRLRYVELF